MGQPAFGTLFKRGDGALRTLTLASVTAGQQVVIQGITFTAHAATTTPANREFTISGADAADATELAGLINNATYGVPGVYASNGSPATAIITLYNEGVITPSTTALTITVPATVTDGAASETFTTLGEVTGISGPTFSLDTIDTTHHSVTGGYREIVPSFKSAGEVTVEMNFDPSSSQQDMASGILEDFTDRALRNWKIVYPTPTAETFSFAGYVTGFEPSAPVDGKLSATLTVSISGAVTQA